jgi:hypothetical protein
MSGFFKNRKNLKILLKKSTSRGNVDKKAGKSVLQTFSENILAIFSGIG